MQTYPQGRPNEARNFFEGVFVPRAGNGGNVARSAEMRLSHGMKGLSQTWSKSDGSRFPPGTGSPNEAAPVSVDQKLVWLRTQELNRSGVD